MRLHNLLNRNAKRGEFRAQGNTIYLYDVIVPSDEEAEYFGGVSPGAFIRALEGMSGDVTLRINSPGGEVFAARAMAQHVREYAGGEVTVRVDGLAASAATFLAVSGKRTIIAPGAMMMIHKAMTIGLGNADEMRAVADRLEKVDGTIAETYAAKSGRTAEEFAPLMAAETWFTDAEAVAAGLADEVAGEKAKVKNAAGWDLTAFDHAPEQMAAIFAVPEPERVEEIENRETVSPPDDVEPAEEIERRRRMTAVRLLQTPA